VLDAQPGRVAMLDTLPRARHRRHEDERQGDGDETETRGGFRDHDQGVLYRRKCGERKS
jgi:hypothetical protein